MKKVFSVLLCLLLIAGFAVSASAAGSSVSISPSATTLHRGDTFTIVANLFNTSAINLGTVVLDYDTNVFEMTGGTCHVSGANPAQVIPASKAGTFFLGTASAVSGKIFTFNFKVKADAAFGSYNFTTKASIGTSTGNYIDATGTTVTVACKHSYGSWTKVSDTQHSRTCSICKNVEKVNHAWDSGKVTKPATCKEAGVKTYTCSGCKATKTETIAQSTTHTYSEWTKVSDTQHKHTCSVCSKVETANHTWNAGTVTKQATCKETGVKTYTCTVCNATKTETIAKLTTHTYGNWTKVNDTIHKHTCSVCSKEETASHTWNSGVVTKAATCKDSGVKTFTCTTCNGTKTETIAKLTTHSYDNACDTSCNICGLTRTIAHSYQNAWSKDKTNHWHECSVCKDKKDQAAHTPGAEATETTAQICTTCGYVIKSALGHKHSYATTWTTDANGHWYACSGCEEKGSYAEHDFENACDKDCSICGYTRDVDHSYAAEWTSDSANHWHECAGCGEKADEAAHEPGAEATETTAQTCTICGYEIAPALGVKDTEPTTTPVVPTEPVGGNEPSTDPTVWIVVAVAVVLLGGGAAGIIIWKKKH